MICGSCGMRMDGAAVLACKTRMYDIAQSGHVPVISAMGNLPILKDLVVDMEALLGKIKAVKPYLDPATSTPARRSSSSRRSRSTSSTRRRSASCAAAASPSATRWRRTRTSSARPRSPKGMRFVGDARDRTTTERLQSYRGTVSGTARAATSARSAVRRGRPRDAIAKLGAEAMHHGIDHDMGAKHAKWFVTSAKTTGWLRETERAEDPGRRQLDQGDGLRDEPPQAREGAAAGAAARGEGRGRGARALRHRQDPGTRRAPTASSRSRSRSCT